MVIFTCIISIFCVTNHLQTEIIIAFDGGTAEVPPGEPGKGELFLSEEEEVFEIDTKQHTLAKSLRTKYVLVAD